MIKKFKKLFITKGLSKQQQKLKLKCQQFFKILSKLQTFDTATIIINIT